MAARPVEAAAIVESSGEGGFSRESWFPAFDRVVRYALKSMFNGINGEVADHVEDVGGNAIRDLQHVPEGLGGEHCGASEDVAQMNSPRIANKAGESSQLLCW